MLLLRPRSKSDGRKRQGRVPVHRVRGRKYGPIVHEQTLKTRQDLAIYGPHSAGKSRWIAKLHAGAADIWMDWPALLIRGMDPITQWIDQPEVAAWHDRRPGVQPWAKLPQHARLEALICWTQEFGAVLLIDDAHRLSGRKADLVLRLVGAARIVVHSASEETRIGQSLRLALARRSPQIVRLSSEAAYDYTSALTWLMCLIAAACGAWPVAVAIGGLKMAARGSRAAKQN